MIYKYITDPAVEKLVQTDNWKKNKQIEYISDNKIRNGGALFPPKRMRGILNSHAARQVNTSLSLSFFFLSFLAWNHIPYNLWRAFKYYVEVHEELHLMTSWLVDVVIGLAFGIIFLSLPFWFPFHTVALTFSLF